MGRCGCLEGVTQHICRPGMRPCWGVITDYDAMERMGKAYNPTDRRIFVGAYERGTNNLLLAPDAEFDTFVPIIPGSNPPQSRPPLAALCANPDRSRRLIFRWPGISAFGEATTDERRYTRGHP